MLTKYVLYIPCMPEIENWYIFIHIRFHEKKKKPTEWEIVEDHWMMQDDNLPVKSMQAKISP